jgi:hypothetical protein
VRRDPGPARHERPALDEAALAAARDVDLAIVAAGERGAIRWVAFLDNVPDRLRDAPLADLRGVAMRVRSAFGPKDSIREALPPDVSEPLMAHIDRLLKLLAREERS